MTTIIAEVGINHNGHVLIAKQLMDMALRCGADFVKFQKRSVDAFLSESSLRLHFGCFGQYLEAPPLQSGKAQICVQTRR